jgi:hypothetical protein
MSSAGQRMVLRSLLISGKGLATYLCGSPHLCFLSLLSLFVVARDFLHGMPSIPLRIFREFSCCCVGE